MVSSFAAPNEDLAREFRFTISNTSSASMPPVRGGEPASASWCSRRILLF
jgi:hypothetical protein